MRNGLGLIADDHRKVEDLFAQFEETSDEAVAAEICDELTVHTTVEESIVYPALGKLDRALEQEAEREHDEARQLIERIRETSGDALVDLVAELKSAIEHHVSEEESVVFTRLQELGDDRLEEMGQEILEAKRHAVAG